MEIAHSCWGFLTSHWVEIILAIVFALIADLIGIGSRFRAILRHLKNKLAERSVARLRNRIKELETERDRYAGFLNSDKVLYLATFRLVIGILIFLAFGAGITALADTVFPPFTVLGVFCYLIAVVVGIQGMKISALDSQAKVTLMIAKLASEITELERKLEDLSGQ